MNKALLLLSAACVAACSYDTRFGDCLVTCADDAACPDGLACGTEGLCRQPGVAAACSTIVGDAGGADAPTQSLSCAGLAPTCGPSGTDDCCASPSVPGGTFYRSHDVASDGMFPDTSYPATVSAFRLDRFEVTVGRFRAFVAAGEGTQARPPAAGTGAHARIPGSGWDVSWNSALATDTAALEAALQCDAQYQTWTASAGANEDLPINCVTWYEAMAFCVWDGGTLPTEAEWNFAAAGGDEQRAYPWSSPAESTTIDCAHANYTGCVSGLRPVGSSPEGEGRWGQSDLAGNAWEWVLDTHVAYSDPCVDCAALTSSTQRVNRGGGFSFDTSHQRTALRGFEDPTPAFATLGVRCAREAL